MDVLKCKFCARNLFQDTFLSFFLFLFPFFLLFILFLSFFLFVFSITFFYPSSFPFFFLSLYFLTSIMIFLKGKESNEKCYQSLRLSQSQELGRWWLKSVW